MTKQKKDLVRTALFVAGGMAFGLLWYLYVGCSSGSCVISSDPAISAVYMGGVGFLLSRIFRKGCDGGCST